jgi:hypothetical protein
MVYHKLHIRYHELSTNLIIFKLCLHFIQLKNIATTCGISWFVNKMFKVSPNFMDKVLKLIKLDEYHFSTYFTPLLYALVVQIWFIRKKFFKWHIIVKNIKFIETYIKLKYRVRSTKINFFKNTLSWVIRKRTTNVCNTLIFKKLNFNKIYQQPLICC